MRNSAPAVRFSGLHTYLPTNSEKLRAADCFTAPLLTFIQFYDNIPKGPLPEKQSLFAAVRRLTKCPKFFAAFIQQ